MPVSVNAIIADSATEAPESAPRLSVSLVGRLGVRFNGRPIELRTRKAGAVLSYLALSEAKQESRERLVGLLWSRSDEEKARASLRQVVRELRSMLEDAGYDGFVAERLIEIETELDSIFTEHRPAAVGVEQLYSHYAHPRTAILMGHARGVILLVAQRHKVAIHEFAANRVKQSLTGHGHADKGQMQRAIMATWNLEKPPEPPDVADALAIALCCGRSLG